MPFLGEIVVIKRNGTDGTHFPLTANSCLFGRKKECDIRIQLPQVSKEHCKIEVNENKEAVLFNLSSANPTQLNGNLFQDPTHLKHGDILTIIDRSFRFEYPPSSLPQKRLSRSQEKETLQILHVQHMQQMDLLHPQNSDYKSSPITGKKFEICSPRRNEKRLQKQYSTSEFKYKMHNTEKANELSPFSKLYELMKHEDSTGNVKENTGNETLLEDVFSSRSRRSAMSRAKLTKVEQSEDSKIQGKHDIVASPIPTFEEKNSEKSSSTQNCDIQQKRECEGTNQSDFKNIEDNELEKYAHFKAGQHFSESCILSLDYAEKVKCLNKFNVTDAFTSVENTLPKTKPNQESTQNYSSPRSRKSRRSSKSRRTGVEIDSLNRMKSSGEMKECPVQVSGQEHESDILIESIYSQTNENRELVTETALNLKDSEDGNSSTVFSSLHLNTSENCNNNIALNKAISNEYSYTEAIDKESIIPADLSQTSEIMANEIPEKNLEAKYPTNENKKLGTENREQNINIKNDIPTFSSYESRVQTSAKVNAVSEMHVLCPLNKKSEVKKSPQKRRGTELDFLVQSLGKRKRVSFGGQLSPELFDKRLPPNSPLKKGAIPARLSMPFGNSPRAVLKKAAELRQSVTQGSFEKKQYENIVLKQASVPQRLQCISDPHVASQSSEGEETTTQEMHMNSVFNEVKKTVSNAASSLRRSKPCALRRSSIRGKSGAMGTIHSKRRSGASEANLMVVKSWAEVVKQGVPKVQLKSSKQAPKTRSMKKVASKSSKNNNSLKTPKRKISGHFSTGHANSPAPIVIGKAHSGILNITAQVPKVVISYPLKKHCDLNESFTGLAENFCSPPNGKQKSFVPETQISEINASEEFEKKSVLDVNISSPKRSYNQDVILEEVSQIPIHDNLMVSLNERNIMGMEEENLQQESEPVRQLLEIKRLLKTPKQKSEPVEALSAVKRFLKTPKQKSEPIESLSAVKRLLRTPKEKSESDEMLSGVKRLLRTPKQKSEPVEALSAVKRFLKTPKQKSEPIESLSGVKRLLRTPKEKSESDEMLSGVKRLLRTPKEKSESDEMLSGVKRLLRTPKQKSEPVEALSEVKRPLKTPKQKSEPIEALSGVKGLLRTPKEKSESDEMLSGVKRLLRTPKEKSESDEMLSGVKRLLRTPKQKSEPVEALSEVKRPLKTPKQKSEPIEALSGVKGLLRTPKQKSEPVEALSAVKRPLKTPKQKSEPIEALSGVKRLLRTPKQKSEPVEGLSGIKRLFKSPKKKFEPVEDFSGVKRLFNIPKEKYEPVEDLSGIKRLFNIPKEKYEPVEDLSGIKRLLETPEQKSEPVAVFSGIKTLKTPRQTMEPLADDTKSRLSTEELLKDMIGSVTKNKTQIMEDININGITEEVKETVKPIEDSGNIKMMSPKERFEPINNMVGSSQTLKASKSLPIDDYLGLQKFMIEPRESSIIPDIDNTGVKEMLDTENDKAKMPESLNFVGENGSYISSRNKLESMENVPGSCEANLEIKIEKEFHFPGTENNSSVPNHIGHVACNSFNELKTEFNKKTTRRTSLSENYEPDGMIFKNEAKIDFVKEAAENSDALKTEKPKPLALARTRRKINNCSSAVYTKMIQRPTKNRSTSANCEQVSESFDSHTELNPLHKSESNFATIETTKLSQRGRPKKQHVETNGNIGSDNINHTQVLEKSLKEETVEKQSVNRRKVATKRKGKTVRSMDLEENGPIQENESDITVKTMLRSRNVKKCASDVKTTFAKGKANDIISGEESNKRRKFAAIQSSPETLITTLNADKKGRQKCTVSKIRKTEASENNLTAVEENLVGKKKKVQFLLKDYFKASEKKCALGYESNIHKEEESQTEHICNGIPKVPLESMQTPAEASMPRMEKLSKKNLPSRGRGKKSVSSPCVESEINQASDGKDHDVIVSLKENQPRRGRGRKKDQVLLKYIPLENNTSGDSTANLCPSSQGGCSLPQVQNENFEESEMLPLENVQNHEGHMPPKRVVKENPPRRGRSKQVNEPSGNKGADVQGPNMAIRQEDNQSKRTRGKRNTQESCSLKSQKTVKENPPRRGRHKKTISGDVSTDSDNTHITPIIDENIDGKNACLAKEDQSKVGRKTRNTVVFQKILSPVSCHLLSSNRGEHSDEQPNEDLRTANNANENFTYNCRKRKGDHEISANSVFSSKKSEFIDNDIQQNGRKDSKAVSKQNTSRNKRKLLTLCGTSTENNDELRINNKKSPLVTDNVGPLENNFGKKHQSKKQREETNIASLASPSLKVSITLSPLPSANENQSGNSEDSVGKKELAKLSGTYNITTRSRKYVIPKEELVHETQNKDLQKTATATVINQRRGRRKINKLEAAVSPSLKKKCTLSAGSDNFPNKQILNNVSNKKVSLMGKAPKFLELKTMTQNINQNDLSNYDQNKNLKHSNMLVEKNSSERAKRKINSKTVTTSNIVKNIILENKSTVPKTVQTRGKRKMKEENTTLMTELPKETEGRTRASKRIRK